MRTSFGIILCHIIYSLGLMILGAIGSMEFIKKYHILVKYLHIKKCVFNFF